MPYPGIFILTFSSFMTLLLLSIVYSFPVIKFKSTPSIVTTFCSFFVLRNVELYICWTYAQKLTFVSGTQARRTLPWNLVIISQLTITVNLSYSSTCDPKLMQTLKIHLLDTLFVGIRHFRVYAGLSHTVDTEFSVTNCFCLHFSEHAQWGLPVMSDILVKIIVDISCNICGLFLLWCTS